MRHFGKPAILLLALVVPIAFVGCPPPSAPEYSIIMLDDREGAGAGINDLGEVVGQVLTSPGQRRGFIWRSDHTPKLTVLDTLGGDNGYAGGINDLTVVAGYASTDLGWTHAMRWAESGGVEDLGALGVGYSAALDINNEGEIVGHTGYTDGSRRAFIWKPSTGMEAIPGAPADSFAKAINELSTTVGATHNEDHIGTADPPVGKVWYADGTLDTILSGLGGNAAIPTGINDAGTVVGFAEDADAQFRAFKWTRSGGMTDLGSLGHCISDDYLFCSTANDINSVGDIVGAAAVSEDRIHAVLWKNTNLYDLNDQIPGGTDWEYLADASAINMKGCIVGRGFVLVDDVPVSRPFLLVPVRLKRVILPRGLIHGGDIVTGSILLDGNAPLALDVTLRLNSLSGAARLEAKVVTVPAGADSADFRIITEPIATTQAGEVIAEFGGITLTRSLAVIPR